MDNPRVENMLNLALDATEEEREKSLNLDVGFDREDRTWELIVKYNGALSRLAREGLEVVELMNEYAVLRIRESLLDWLTAQPQIEYIEKPKKLFFSVLEGRRASCITAVQNARYNLFGDGILVAALDSGECVIIMSS